MTAVDEESATPQFAHAVRGYDRYQVDEYVQRLHEWAGGTQARAEQAERQAAGYAEEVRRLQEQIQEMEAGHPASPERAVGDAAEKAAEYTAAAIAQADQLRRRASQEAERRLAEATRQAEEMIESVRQAMAGFGEETTQQRRDARARADAISEEAIRDADAVRRQAAADAEQMMGEARAAAERMVAEAEEAARHVREQALEENRQANEGLERLRTEKSEIVAELGRLRGAIQSLIAGPGGPEGDAAPTTLINLPAEHTPDR